MPAPVERLVAVNLLDRFIWSADYCDSSEKPTLASKIRHAFCHCGVLLKACLFSLFE
jgi:hypothetical protein